MLEEENDSNILGEVGDFYHMPYRANMKLLAEDRGDMYVHGELRVCERSHIHHTDKCQKSHTQHTQIS